MNEKYWGYLHSNGSVQVKRWFGDVKDYTTDCNNNEFVVRVVPPFTAESKERARYFVENKVAAYRQIKNRKRT